MCLAIPGRIVTVDGAFGVADFRGVERRVGLALVPEAAIGDWILVHAGYAIQTLDAGEAEETLRLLDEAMGGDA